MKKFIIPFSLIIFIATSAFVQIFNTSLKITVRNELGNTEEGVEVVLFSNEEDYKKEENPVTEKLVTDKKGQVKFKDLEPKAYYILAKKGEKNNWGAGEITDVLQEGKLNKVTIIIE